MGRPATFNDLTEILRDQSEAIQKRLNVARANMFIPTDGKGLRIRVSVPQDCPAVDARYIPRPPRKPRLSRHRLARKVFRPGCAWG